MGNQIFWAGIAPEHWNIIKAKHVLQHHNRKVEPEDEIVTAFRDGQVTLRANRRTEGFTMSLKEIGYHHVCVGDLVVHSMDGGFGAIGVSDSDGKASPVVHTSTSNVADLHFVAHQLRTAAAFGWVAANGKGIRVRSTQFDRVLLDELELALPSLQIQRAIVDYLDRETTEIDAMTADLDELEKLLTERRDATLARLLSEAEQSGMQIRNVRVKFLCDIGTGHGDTQDASDGGAYPFYVRSANVLRSSEWDIQGPAVLTAGDGAGVGRVFHYAEGKMKVHQRVYALTNFRNVNPRFFYEAFRQYFPETVLYGGASSTVSSLRMHMLADLNLPIPPLEEQRRITAEIDRETAEIDAMLADIMELRDLIAERRAAVIAAAVTGQIDIPVAEETTHA